MCDQWLSEAIDAEQTDPTAMVLSTLDSQGRPDARVVLLKAIRAEGFVFYTHLHSAKGQQLAHSPACALTLYWPVLARQLRVRGIASLLPATDADAYFADRPYESQLSACASPQSQPIANRQVLEEAIAKLRAEHPEGTLKRPETWGGYGVSPQSIEFWQGRDNRVHDRLLFTKQGEHWAEAWLAP
jgi:pyridoxamine 5'-phosphate oxidase